MGQQYNQMLADSSTSDLKRGPAQCPESHDDEGFAEDEAESLIVPKLEAQDDLALPKSNKIKVVYREPRLKLTFISKERNPKGDLQKSILSKEARPLQPRSLDISKRDSRKSLQFDLLVACLAPIKRTAVGQNLSIPTFSLVDSRRTKSHILSSGFSLVYEQTKQTNTHGYIHSIVDQHSGLLGHGLNQLLKLKMRDSFIVPKKAMKPVSQGRDIEFQGDYENGNLQFAAEVGEDEFDLYLRNDTNTHGHQSWFSFKVSNRRALARSVVLNLCNLKRNLGMYQEGGRVYLRQEDGQWEQGGENIQFRCDPSPKFTSARVYKLTFELDLPPESTLEVSLLPSYSYSDLLVQVTELSCLCPHLTVQTLTYSLVGLAIPVLSFTRGQQGSKQVVLVSCRIHPGEANSSFMCSGLMKWLSEDTAQTRQFLEKHVIKVVPMINPDGVIFGNFRTNFLGADLNRSFDTDDEVTNPEVSALKELGLRLKAEHGERFTLFLDLHGHSSQRNIFSYGPEYEPSDSNFHLIRLLPKILNLRSRVFKYCSCTFKLEGYKKHTARGFYLNSVGVLAYTIQAGFGFYQDEGKLVAMGPKQWIQFGRDLAESIMLLGKVRKLSLMRNQMEIKKALGEADREQIEMIKCFRKELKSEKEEPPRQERRKEGGGEDSDGEGDCEDYTRAQKEQVVRRVAETAAPNFILPRVLKPSILYPMVAPNMFQYHQDYEQTQLKVLYTRRASKYSGLRMNGNSYVLNLRGMEPLKGDGIRGESRRTYF